MEGTTSKPQTASSSGTSRSYRMHDVRDMEAMAAAADLKGKAEQVAQFTSQVVGFPIPEKPQLLSEDRQAFRQGFLKEEMDEIDAAYKAGDLEEVVDGHIDAIYVHLGALVEMGVVATPCFEEVHGKNLQKKRGGLSKRGKSGGFDAVKPEGWTKPSHADYLSITKADVETILAVRSGKFSLRFVPQSERALVAVRNNAKMHYDPHSPTTDADIYKAMAEVIYTRELVPNDDFEYVGPESRLNGEDGYVLAVDDEGGYDIKFYRSDLPQLMSVSRRDIKYKPKKRLVGGERNDPLPDYGQVITTPNGNEHTIEERKPKILVMGYARHGKDTVADLLQQQYKLKFTSSSAFCAERVIMPAIKKLWAKWDPIPGELKGQPPAIPDYSTVQECFEDRHNHRAFWYDTITAYNTPDLTALGRAIFEGHDVYCGIRNAREFHALRNAGVFDVAIWVDAYERIGAKEDESSCTVEPWMADCVLDNNGSLADLERNLKVLMEGIL
jgi:predicted HAD superfamily Cof-like phosphohydrolase